MKSLKIKYNHIAFFFVFLFISRGFAQSLFSIKFFTNTAILHVFSLGLLVFLYLVYFNAEFNRRKLKREHVVLLLASLYFLTTSLFNNYFNLTDFITYVMPIITFGAVYELRKHLNFNLILKITVLVLAIQILYLVASHGLSGIVSRQGRDGLGSIFGHANSLALIAACYFIVSQRSRIIDNFGLKKLFSNGFAFLVIAIIGARSMLLSVAMGIGFWLFFRGRVTRFRLLLMVTTYALLTSSIVYYGISLLEASWQEQSFTSGNSLKWRIIHWLYYLQDFTDLKSVFFGFGIGSHEVVTDGLYIKYLEVHNDFLRILYDVGIVGLTFYLIFDYVIYMKLKRNIDVDWRFFLLLATKYFFMFFDNYVTNMLSVTGMMILYVEYARLREIKK